MSIINTLTSVLWSQTKPKATLSWGAHVFATTDKASATFEAAYVFDCPTMSSALPEILEQQQSEFEELCYIWTNYYSKRHWFDQSSIDFCDTFWPDLLEAGIKRFEDKLKMHVDLTITKKAWGALELPTANSENPNAAYYTCTAKLKD